MKPWLALDVDGPLVLLGEHDPAAVVEAWAGDVPVTLSRELPGRLQRLLGSFQVVWSTSWGRQANTRIAPLVGLPTNLPVLNFGRYPPARPGETRKLPGLKAWLRDAPAAIVDDEVGHDLLQWAAGRSAPTLVLEIDPRGGLLDEHVEQLLHFAADLRRP